MTPNPIILFRFHRSLCTFKRAVSLLCFLVLLFPLPVRAQWHVAVFPFENQSSDPNQDWLSHGISETLIGQIYKTPRIFAFGRERLREILGEGWRQVRENPALAEKVQTHIVLQGTYRVVGNRVEIQANIFDTRKRKTLQTAAGAAPVQQFFDALKPVLLALVQTLGVPLSPDEKNALQAPAIQNAAAVRASIETLLSIQNTRRRVPAEKAVLDRVIGGFERAIDLDPTYADPHYRLGGFYEIQNMPGKAEDAYRKALAIDQGHVGARLRLGRLLKAQNRPSEAMAELETAIHQSPMNPGVQKAFSTIFFNQYDQTFETMSRQLREVADSSASDPAVCYELGNAQEELGHFDEAAKYYRRALAQDPNHADAHFKLGLVYQQQSLYKEAVLEMQAAIQLGTSLRRVHFRLAEILFWLNRYPEAAEQFEQALKTESNYTVAYYHLGLCRLQMGREDDALATFQKYAELSVDDNRPHVQIGEIHRKRGNLQQALAAYRRSLSISATDVDVYLHLGDLYADLNDRPNAVQALQTALRIQPNHPDAEKIRASIREWQK